MKLEPFSLVLDSAWRQERQSPAWGWSKDLASTREGWGMGSQDDDGHADQSKGHSGKVPRLRLAAKFYLGFERT